MKQIGTVLPNAASLKINDDYAARLAADQQRVAGEGLKGLTKKVVGGEVRYYKNNTKYAIVNRDLKVQWFEVRADGDYPVKG